MGITIVRIVDKEGDTMRKPRKRSFAELVLENKRQLLKDQAAMDKIEERLEEKRLGRAE
ncbi:Fur-regulated basic protein B [Bacillus sp. cl95]|nr:Fur-regulated basic protein B [Bacillus sp. UNCCL13]SFQ84770.1 Fur-regulated basic protein B [Bacillus sp. cl95]